MRLVWCCLFASLVACSAAPTTSGGGVFQPATDDVTVDPVDPPTDPDPIDAPASSTKCPDAPAVLSPVGLTFVLHVSRDAANAADEVKHLGELTKYIRARDVFMIEHGSPAVASLRAMFPCNRFHEIAFPDGMKNALSTGGGVGGVAVDWEGDAVDGHRLLWSIERLRDYAGSIHAHGKVAAFVPSWTHQTQDAYVTIAAKMDYALAQIQGSCVTGADAFASYAHTIVSDFHDRGNARNVGFEISMDSYAAAGNHVDADRAAACTRKAYGRGARAIYIYGNGHDQLVPYFHALDQMGVRSPQ